MKTISVSSDFGEYPGLRNCSISEKSGEEFYHEVLNNEFKVSLEAKDMLIINLDYTDGYASSFLDEAFGNLVYDFHLDNVKKYIEIISNQEPHWKTMIEEKTYNQWEERRKRKEEAKVTKKHKPWYRLIEGKFVMKVWTEPSTL